MIVCRDLSFSYPGSPPKPVLSRIDLTWRESEFVSIYGNNGSGKSTLGLCLTGVLRPSGGAVELDGRPVGAGGGFPFPDVGLVFQNPDDGFFAETVKRDAAFNLENLNRPSAEIVSGADRALSEVGISHLADRPLSGLSQGEKKLAALAGALSSNPRFLIIDEPTSLLDPDWSRRVRVLLKRLNERGLGVMVLTCDLEDLQAGGTIRYLAGAGLRTGDGIETAPMVPAGGGGEPGGSTAVGTDPDHTIVRVEGLGLDRGETLFEDVGFTVSRGEVLGIVGPNASGKTELLMVLAGIVEPDRGRVIFIEGPPPPGYIGLAFQDPEDGLFAQTVEEELELARNRYPGVSSSANGPETVRGALGLVGLSPEDYLARSPWTLSMGEARRAALAALVVGGAELILLDEPVGSLDPPGRSDLAVCLRRLADEGRAVVITACRPETADSLCDRVLYLAEGRLSAKD